MHEIKCIVIGKVQGVDFRNFVKTKANSLWLTGYVENTSNRNVLVIAQGPEEKLEKLIEHLHKGPFTARVSSVEVEWHEPDEKYHGFSIRY